MDMKAVVARLTLLAACCGLLVSATDVMTHGRIVDNRNRFAARQLQAVVGVRHYQISKVANDLYLLTNREGNPAGFIFDVSTEQGYNGHIGLWVAADLSGKILGVRVKDQHETPGLGDKIELDVSPWILSFNGTSLALGDTAWHVKKDGGDFDQFTGATITPRAVVRAVHDGLARFEAHKGEWMTEAKHEL